MSLNVVIIDYGLGNIHAFKNVYNYLNILGNKIGVFFLYDL